MDLKLKNKISLVCAASEGLGKAAALELAKEGSTIAISSRNKEKLELAKNEISSEDYNNYYMVKNKLNKTLFDRY